MDCPIKYWDHPLVQEMFHKIIKLKLTGFHSKKPANYLPIDTFDYIGTHVIACKEHEDASLHPIMGFKAITLERCLHYRQTFPGRSCVSSVESEIHKMALDQYINRSLSDGHSLGYAGSFAIDPSLQRNEKLGAMKLLFPLFALYRRESNLSRLICLGSVRSKTHITFRKLGFNPLSHDGDHLPPVCVPVHLDEEFEVMTLESLSAECEASANANQELWNARIRLSDNAMTTRHPSSMISAFAA